MYEISCAVVVQCDCEVECSRDESLLSGNSAARWSQLADLIS
jgi:hypothetical protein